MATLPSIIFFTHDLLGHEGWRRTRQALLRDEFDDSHEILVGVAPIHPRVALGRKDADVLPVVKFGHLARRYISPSHYELYYFLIAVRGGHMGEWGRKWHLVPPTYVEFQRLSMKPAVIEKELLQMPLHAIQGCLREEVVGRFDLIVKALEVVQHRGHPPVTLGSRPLRSPNCGQRRHQRARLGCFDPRREAGALRVGGASGSVKSPNSKPEIWHTDSK